VEKLVCVSVYEDGFLSISSPEIILCIASKFIESNEALAAQKLVRCALLFVHRRKRTNQRGGNVWVPFFFHYNAWNQSLCAQVEIKL